MHSLEGEDVELRNVILTLPGESARSVVVLAARDSADGFGAASSAAATATLLELVEKLRTSSHTNTLVFVSTELDVRADPRLRSRRLRRRHPRRRCHHRRRPHPGMARGPSPAPGA